MSISTFRYQALDSAGGKRDGVVRAAGEQEAYRKVASAGLTPLKLREVRERRPLLSFQRVTLNDVVGLTRELAVLVEARIPLDRGLISIAEHETRPQMSRMIRDIAATIESGSPMTTALEKYKAVFGDVYIETVRAAEKSGAMQEVMHHLAEMLERQMEMRQQLRRAMAYPIIVMTMVTIAVTIIVGFVVPKFAETFRASKVDLPLATRVVQGIGYSVQNQWWAYLTVLVGGVLGLMITWRDPKGRIAMEEFLLRAPYVGKVMIAVCTSRFARVMGISLMSGLDVIEAITIAGGSTGRPGFVNECRTMGSRLRQGDRLSDVLQETRYMPSFAKRMVGAGKDSKELGRACDIVARHYDREASHLTKNISTVIEPLLTVAMAAIVLIVALAVFLPMWQMVKLRH